MVTITAPSGFSLDKTGERLYYTKPNGKLALLHFSWLAPGGESTRANVEIGKKIAQTQYGINLSSLPTANPADMEQLAKSVNGIDSGGYPKFERFDVSDFSALQKQPTQAISQTYNEGLGNVANPNAGFQATGSTAEFSAPVSPTPSDVKPITLSAPSPTVPIGQTPTQMATTFATTGQYPYSYTPPPSPPVPKLPSTITAGTLQSGQSYNFRQSPQTSYTPASSVDATYTPPTPALGAKETELSKEIEAARAGNVAGIGKTSFEAQQRQQEGIDNLIKAQDDIASQILMLQAEDKNLEAKMQKGAEGRGITTGGLAPQTAAERRDLGIRANVLSAQLAASQGKLASANARIAQAVKDKFGPKEEEQKIRIANLELLAKDPNLILEEKNRANEQLLVQKQMELNITQVKTNQADIWKVSTDASANIANFTPTPQYQSPALAINAIQNAPTKEQALAIALATGLTKQPTALSDFEQAFLRDKGRLPTLAELTAYNVSQKAPRDPFGALSSADEAKGLNYLLANGGTTEDQQKFRTDRAFQAWVMDKAYQAGY